MEKRLATLSLAMIFCVGLNSQPVQAQQDSEQTKTLKGINTVYVLVENLPDGAKALGISKEMIQTDVELKLRLAGMRVVTAQEGIALPGSPNLYVNLNLIGAEAASIDVDVEENATLERSSQFAPSVITWSKGALIARPTAQGIRDWVKDLVDRFLNDWLSVNPKK